MPIPIPPLAVVWVCFPATSVPKPLVERAWIFFFFPLINGSAVRHFFPGILSLSLPGRLNELFSLRLALTFLRARPWAAGSCWRGGAGWQGPPLRGNGRWMCTAREAAVSWRTASAG